MGAPARAQAQPSTDGPCNTAQRTGAGNDVAGRLNDIVTPSGTYHRDYYGLIPCVGCAAGRLSRLTSPDAVTLDYQYDGQLLTKSTWSGAVNGAVAFAYNADFRVKTETVTTTSGSAAYQFGFDADTLL
ncbi:MAG TPA: hypothetical protein VHP33_20285, partial [Polyangiaceae bacterium]|nr:hypothetical protein [Polyangiaceae bacterium]